MATGLDRRERAVAGLAAAGLVAALLHLLVIGLAITPRAVADRALKVFGVAPPPPPPPPDVAPPHRPSHRPAGRAAPPALRAQATEVVAPRPQVVLPPPPPVVVAPKPFEGAQASQGAADVAGPGTGAGGAGDGTGAGGDGRGDGAGDVPPRQIGGWIKDRDYPREAAEQGISGTVVVDFYVDGGGRASRCRVTRSSGNRALDDTTCRIIDQRFRFRPGHDARGRPFGAWLSGNRQEWIIDRGRPRDEDDDDDRD